MTLALYGKTRRRQGGLILAGFLAIFAAVLIAVTAMGSGREANAVNLSISDVDGVWSGAVGASPTITTDANFTRARWGTAADQNCTEAMNATFVNGLLGGVSDDRSGYVFDSVDVPQNFVDGAVIPLGAFTHVNCPISGATITSINLGVTLDFTSPAVTTLTLPFTFSHDETDNGANPCKYGEAPATGVNSPNGCRDQVSAPGATSAQFQVGDALYVLQFVGFDPGGTGFADSCVGVVNPVTSLAFLTSETLLNHACLYAKVLFSEPVIEIVKTPDAGVVTVPNPIVWGITVNNNGGAAANDVSFTDTLPALPVGMTWAEDSANCSIAGLALSCTLIDLPATTGTFTVNVTSMLAAGPGTNAQSCAVYNNTATINSAGHGTDSDSGSVTVNGCVTSSATGVKTSNEVGGDGTVDRGEDFEWVIPVTVSGANTTGPINISDTIQSPLVIRPGAWDLDDGTGAGTLTCPDQVSPIACTIATGATPGTYVVKIPVEVPPGASNTVCGALINNTAVISGPNVVGTPGAEPNVLSVSDTVTVNPCPPETRTVRIIKTTNNDDHPGGSFSGTILPGQTTPSADSTWDATLAPDAVSAPAGSFETSQTVQTVDENTPPSGWAENGYAVIPDPNGSATCSGATYAAVGSATVPAGSADYLVCVRNTFTPQTIQVCKIVLNNGDGIIQGGDFTFTSEETGDTLTLNVSENSPDNVNDSGGQNAARLCGELTVSTREFGSDTVEELDSRPASWLGDASGFPRGGTGDTAHCDRPSTSTVDVGPNDASVTFCNKSNENPTITIKICKILVLDQGETPNADPSTFAFDVSDTSETEQLTIGGVVEGGGPECETVDVEPGQVTIEELIANNPGFEVIGWSLEDDATEADVHSAIAEIFVNSEACFDGVPAFAGQSVLGLVRDIFAVVIPGGDDPVCTITFFNRDDQVTEPSGSIRIEVYLDINRDGDANDPGEGLFPTGAFPNWPFGILNGILTGNYPNATGALQFDGLTPGDTYNIDEGPLLPGFIVVRATVNGANMGAISALANVAVPNGGVTVVRFYNSPSGSITVHKNTVNVLNGIETPNLNDDDGWRITVDSTACNVHVSGLTDASGNITFTGLEMCSDYRVAEDLSVTGAAGYTPAGSAVVNGVTPGATVPTLVTFTNETRSFTPPCPHCAPATQTVPTPIPTPPVATATPCVGCGPGQQNAPTPIPSPTTAPASPTAVSTIAGDRTPGPGQTPVAPSTGGGGPGGGSGLNMLLILGGFIALGSGFTFMAMGRKTRN